ncbi:MAG: MiaB/RimO family radical SAM methylthiotransferase [Verrucomicrobia bacterium]|nr:MAG: MiaB/RimO family radical SAM methylthiotransferase [Verrucomicrobiota bacterium]
MKYSIVTFGCRVNQADSLGFEEDLLARGGTAVAPDQADFVIVNTCSVTATADQGARQTIRRIARDNPSARIVATGCYATRRPEEVLALPNVVRVVPNDDKPKTISLLSTDFGLTTAVRFGEGEGSCGSAIEPGVAGRTAFTLRVQTGCAESCSYCIIPTTRGLPRSVPLADVLAQMKRIVAAGFKEIALTGVHLGSYRRDIGTSLVDLLEAVRRAALSGARADLSFRISSLEPMDCTRASVELVAEGGCFAPHFHLPLQHASNRMLAAMRRPYTIEYYAALVDDLRTRIPHASIGSDVIVGFPGETNEDFERLEAYLDRSPLTHIHVFPYSDRPGTDATSMSGKVGGAVVRERGRRIREIAQRLSQRFRDSQVGSIRRALTVDDGSSVVTDNYLKLSIPPGHVRNERVDVRVLSQQHAEMA